MGKTIEVYPCAGKTPRTMPVWQYDYGQIIHINGIDLPASYKAEFSNTTRGDAIATVQTTDEILHSSNDYGVLTISNIFNKVNWSNSDKTPEHYYGGNSGDGMGIVYLFCNYDDNTEIQITATLETPKLIGFLTPQQFKTLRETNNIWSNANDNIEIAYWAH